MNREEIRKQSRALRNALSEAEQISAARNLENIVSFLPQYRQCKRLAVYLANDGEIDPRFIVETAWRQHKECYLPVLDSQNKTKMHFQRYTPDTELVKGRFGIAEPAFDENLIVPPETLDLVLLPLTAFDMFGNRLGMGGGFYDRTFEFVNSGSRTILMGLAHECQKVDKLPIESWDVPLQGVVTDQQYY